LSNSLQKSKTVGKRWYANNNFYPTVSPVSIPNAGKARVVLNKQNKILPAERGIESTGSQVKK
jgi:hypothetical protein